MSRLSSRMQTAAELFRMALDRRALVLLPLVFAIAVLLVFLTVAEMPVLIPFFYAVF
jgi:hypothetical protein